MGTGLKGTFVISWSQTETDGLQAAPLDVLAVGAPWRWMGEALRVDGVQGVMILEGAEGAAEIRKRAARMVRRLVGAALTAAPQSETQLEPTAAEPPEQGFVVTDGYRSYAVTLINVEGTGANLLMFVDAVPPANSDLWVVSTQLHHQAKVSAAQPSGGLICFTPGTLIRSAKGPRRIEDLKTGDWLQTKDNGLQQVLWVGDRRMTGARLHVMPHLRPIRFRAGAMGAGRPDDDLLVSPQHRMLVKGPAARALFNADEVLVAAEDLLNDVSITVDHIVREVTYIHVLLAQHQVIWANGLETESFHPSNTALDLISPAQRGTLFAALPGLSENSNAYGDYARRNLSRSEAAILRHDLAA